MNTTAVADTIGGTEYLDGAPTPGARPEKAAKAERPVNDALFLSLIVGVQVVWLALLAYAALALF